MGQGLSCSGSSYDHDFFAAVQGGNLGAVETSIRSDPSLVSRTTIYDRLSALHIAAANGRVEVLSAILDRSINPDVVNRYKQTPLMLAAMHGKLACAQKLVEAGANILMFDSLNGRTCLHYAAYYGHSDCLQLILSVAQSTAVADSWGFARFVNVRDGNGATPLHLAARQAQPQCVHILLDNGALVSAVTGGYGYPGSTPLHLAARSGSLDCVRKLLAWGADRLQRDSLGRIPYNVAVKRNHGACAALLNPSAAEPLVWPSPLKFISELDPDAKALLEATLMEANREREKKIFKETSYSLPSPTHSDEAAPDDNAAEESDSELCYICFDQACNIGIQECGHQMCAHCMLALCCHNKRNSISLCLSSPTCPFCRSSISRLVVVKAKVKDEGDEETISKLRKSWRFKNSSEGSSSFKGLSSAMGSSGKMNLAIPDTIDMVDKPLEVHL
ncbi:E3 ubiquitin-protein ligase [Canna indica]|uniref:RING-type E3 ubiquitin transferase n=1 Tax=Canna indica TaxID=4628 RepID=A0AAQ3QMQ7_9LILI|nr:E3 ubiquitin-protein ligase [Canna indica]